MKNKFTLVIIFLLTTFTAFSQTGQFRNNLYIVPPAGKAVLMDGTLSLFHDDYSNEVDRDDARKMTNPSENLAILRDARTLIVERRQSIRSNDTTFYKIWNTRIISYRLELISKDIDSQKVSATLYDRYLDSAIRLSLSSNNYYDFAVTSDVNSKRTDRFYVVLKPIEKHPVLGPPMHYVKDSAAMADNPGSDLLTTDNDMKDPLTEEAKEGERPGSEITATHTRISLYPNPAATSSIYVTFAGQKEGKYKISLIGQRGNVLLTQTSFINSGPSTVQLKLNGRTPRGIYRVEVVGPNGFRSTHSLLITQ